MICLENHADWGGLLICQTKVTVTFIRNKKKLEESHFGEDHFSWQIHLCSTHISMPMWCNFLKEVLIFRDWKMPQIKVQLQGLRQVFRCNFRPNKLRTWPNWIYLSPRVWSISQARRLGTSPPCWVRQDENFTFNWDKVNLAPPPLPQCY